MENLQKDQEFLQSAQESLAAGAQEMVQVSNRLHDNIVNAMRLIWRQLYFVWGLVIVLLVAYFLILHNLSSGGHVNASVEKTTGNIGLPAQVVAPALPPTQQSVKTTPIPEWEEVKGVLEQVREAQLKKNIGQFLQVYSPSFHNLDKKKESILKTWQKFEYLDMTFAITNVQKPDAKTIIAKVAWDITLVDLASKKMSTMKKDYTVYFSHVAGKWLIQDLIQG
jgi:hypothetical protein